MAASKSIPKVMASVNPTQLPRSQSRANPGHMQVIFGSQPTIVPASLLVRVEDLRPQLPPNCNPQIGQNQGNYLRPLSLGTSTLTSLLAGTRPLNTANTTSSGDARYRPDDFANQPVAEPPESMRSQSVFFSVPRPDVDGRRPKTLDKYAGKTLESEERRPEQLSRESDERPQALKASPQAHKALRPTKHRSTQNS